MSDSRITRLRALAQTGDLDSVHSLERALVRAGEDPSECFSLALLILLETHQTAAHALAELIEKRDREISKTYELALIDSGAPMVCADCHGTGLGFPSRAFNPCPFCSAKRDTPPEDMKPYLQTLRPDAALAALVTKQIRRAYKDRLATAHAAELHAGTQLRPYQEALRFGMGALVTYQNPKARARFSQAGPHVGVLVPAGTLGKVFWLGHQQTTRGLYGRSYGRNQRVGLITKDGSKFYTYYQHLDPTVLNPYEILTGKAYEFALNVEADA